MRILPLVLVAALLAGCSSNSGTGPSPASAVYASKNAYAAALTVAVAYNNLPRCGAPTSPPICSDQSTVLVLRGSNDAARITLDAAENTVRAFPGTDAATKAQLAAVNAVDAFTKLTASIKKGN